MRPLRSLLIFLCLVAAAVPAAARDFTDSLGRKVTLPDHIGRVLAAGPPAQVAIYTLAPERLIGWVQPMSAAQLAFVAQPFRTRPVTGGLTGKEGDIGPAEVTALHPDLIVDVGDLKPQYRNLADQIQRETGIPYVVLDGSIEHMPDLYAQLNELLGGGLRGDLLAAQTASMLEHVAARVGTATRPGRIYYAQSRDVPQPMPGPTGLDPAVVAAINAVDFNGQHSVSGHGNVTPGQVAEYNPDIVIVSTPEIAKQLAADPKWRAVAAIAAGKVYTVPSLPFGWLGTPPGVNRLIGLEWLSGLLYPEVPERDLAADVRAFYRNYYQIMLTEAQVRTLLAP